MMIEQNAPAAIRNWAYCQVEIRRYEKLIRLLDEGGYFSLSTYGTYWRFVRQYGNEGKQRYLEEYCKPRSARLKRRCGRYRALAKIIQSQSATPPENWLLSKEEALAMLGSTLHYRRHGVVRYETIRECSDDGNRLFSAKHDAPDGLTPLSLLSLGFGKRLN